MAACEAGGYEWLFSTDQLGRTALHATAGSGYADLLASLLAAAAKGGYAAELLEARTTETQLTALMCAAGHGSTAVVERLLEAGADIEAQDALGQRALHCAAFYGCGEAVDRLIAAAVQRNLKMAPFIDAAMKDGRTALSVAAANGHVEVVQKLLLAGANPGTVDEAGRASLYRAFHSGEGEAVLWLRRQLLAGANNSDGARALAQGDKVRVRAGSLAGAIALQVGHGGWAPGREAALGQHGEVVDVDGDGDVWVCMHSGATLLWNPQLLLPHDFGASPATPFAVGDAVEVTSAPSDGTVASELMVATVTATDPTTGVTVQYDGGATVDVGYDQVTFVKAPGPPAFAAPFVKGAAVHVRQVSAVELAAKQREAGVEACPYDARGKVGEFLGYDEGGVRVQLRLPAGDGSATADSTWSGLLVEPAPPPSTLQQAQVRSGVAAEDVLAVQQAYNPDWSLDTVKGVEGKTGNVEWVSAETGGVVLDLGDALGACTWSSSLLRSAGPGRTPTALAEFDRVRIKHVSAADALVAQAGHGGWRAAMESSLGQGGVVEWVYPDSTVLVRTRIKGAAPLFVWSPALLERMPDLAPGDRVRVRSVPLSVARAAEEVLKHTWELQAGSRADALGATGVVQGVSKDNNSVTLKLDGSDWKLSISAALCKLLPGGSPRPVAAKPPPVARAPKPQAGDSKVIDAVRREAVGEVRKLLAAGDRAEAYDKVAQEYALHKAARMGNLELAKVLLQAGAKTDIRTTSAQDTPLHVASRQGHVDVVALLLQHGANPRATNKLGNAPLKVARKAAVKKELLRALGEPGTPAQQAARARAAVAPAPAAPAAASPAAPVASRRPSLAASAAPAPAAPAGRARPVHVPPTLATKAAPGGKAAPAKPAPTATTAAVAQKPAPAPSAPGDVASKLVAAVRSGDVPGVQALLKAGASPLTFDKEAREFVLHLAAREGHAPVVKALVEAGAKVDDLNTRFRETALHVAVREGHLDAVRELLAANANVNVANQGGETALHMASRARQVETVRELLRCHADVAAVNTKGKTPLQVAGDEAVKQLLTAPPDV